MSSSFMIAAEAEGEEGLTALDALTTPVLVDPQFFFQPYRQRVRLGDGSYRGIGAPVAEWRFPLLSLAERNQLATFCSGASARVYIATPDNTGSFLHYLAVMLLPESEPANKAGLIQGYVVRFEQMEEQPTDG